MNKASSIFITLLMMLWSCNTGQPQADEEQDGGIRGEVDYEEATADSVVQKTLIP